MNDTVVTVTGVEPQRLDAFVRAALPTLSRRVARLAIAEGAVRVNGKRAHKGTFVRPGDQVTLPATARLVPEPDLAVPVLYEDAWVVVVDKPGGVCGHALDPRERGTVASFLLGRYPETAAIGDGLASGLAHRLDRGTSGVLVAARTAAAFVALRAALRRRAVCKRYLAIVAGEPAATAHVTMPLAHDPSDRRRMIAARPGLRSWPAETYVERLAVRGDRTLVQATMATGVTHQIRAHLALLGHPVIGDRLYGASPSSLPDGRHALHARSITFPHPRASGPLQVTSDLPDDLVRLLDDTTARS